jgi:hypothetical protein
MFVELWRARWRLFKKHYSPLFRALAKQIVRAGMWREARKARASLVTQDELTRRLEAYRQVEKLLA